MIQAFAALLCCQLIGELIVRATHLPLPGPLLGMALLFVFFVWHGAVPASIARASDRLFRHMMLFFIPIVSGVIAYGAQVATDWLPFAAACIVGAALTLVVTAAVLQWMLRRAEKASA